MINHWLVISYWYWIRKPTIIKLYGIIDGRHLEEVHQLGDLRRGDEKRVKKEKWVGSSWGTMNDFRDQWSFKSWTIEWKLLTCQYYLDVWRAIQIYHVVSCYENGFLGQQFSRPRSPSLCDKSLFFNISSFSFLKYLFIKFAKVIVLFLISLSLFSFIDW